ncbi:MAG: hypothetical protein AMK75_00090 [Planctomycetes bacterium SM23_65]|nr:MAG: hypothetical protein AMK75_00090 [Planctomycetes bacterium SM23_65]
MVSRCVVAEKLIDISKLSYTYPGREEPSLCEVELSVRAGEFVLLSGPTGCGKSTLLRTMNGIIPHDSGGSLTGRVAVLGRETCEAELAWLSSRVGLVFQSPEDQLFSSRPADEVAFGLENIHLEPDEIRRRVRWALEEVGLSGVADTPIAELSGGQKQRLAIAAVIAMQPKVLVLDEPLSQLDPAGAEQVLEVLKKLKDDLGLTIVLVEHRMHAVVGPADRVVLMESGRIVLDCETDRAFDELDIYERLGLRVPEPAELMHKLGRSERPLSVDDAVALLGKPSVKVRSHQRGPAETTRRESAEPLVELKSVSVRYGRRMPDVLHEVDLRIFPGEVMAVMGANGSGKSTLLLTLLGSLRPSSGSGSVLGRDIATRRRSRGEVAMLLQNPELMLLAERVDEEVAAGPTNLGWSEQEVSRRTSETMRALGIDDLSAEPPLALSRGQRLRVALASILSMRPTLLLLDEPTTGQDRVQIESMMDHLVAPADGAAVVFCTHDMQTAARYANRLVVLAEGRVLADGAPAEIFARADLLRSAGLRPPASVEIARALGLPAPTSVDELAAMFSAEKR